VDNPQHAFIWQPGDARYEIWDYGRNPGTAGGGNGSLQNLLGKSATSYTAQQYAIDTQAGG